MPDAAPGDAEPETAPAPVLTAQDPLAAYDQDMEDHMGTLGPEDDLRRRWLKQGERLKEIRRGLEQAGRARPAPDVTPQQNAAYVAARWDQEAEGTVIPDDMREKLLALVAGEGISARQAVNQLGVPEASRAKVTWWLNRLRWEGKVRLEGKGRGARWKLVMPPGDGDGS